MRLFRNTRIDFLSLRWHATVLSLLVIAAGATSMLLKGGLRMGIDFAGGSQIIARFAEPLDPGELRAVLTDGGLGSSQVQQLDDADEALIRTPLRSTASAVTRSSAPSGSAPRSARTCAARRHRRWCSRSPECWPTSPTDSR
jgi:preprotein translocase subunit SecF